MSSIIKFFKRKFREQRRSAKKHNDRLHRGPRNIFWAADGNLRSGPAIRNRDEELMEVFTYDSSEDDDSSKLWVIMPSRWLRRWLLFTHFKTDEEPGPVSMSLLLTRDPVSPSGMRPKKTLQPPSTPTPEKPDAPDTPGHYRRVTVEVWYKFVALYGTDGPALAVWGIPFDDITRWRVFVDPRNITVDILPPPVLPQQHVVEDVEAGKKEEKDAANPKEEGKKETSSLGGLFGLAS